MSLTSISAKLKAILDGDRIGGGILGINTKDLKLGTRLEELASLGSVVAGKGASQIGIADAGGLITATTVEGALQENRSAIDALEVQNTGITLTAGAESSDDIAVTVAGVAAARQYIAEVYEATMIEAVAGAFTIAETGDGSEVSTTAQARLLFTTSAAGAATLTVSDVAGASGKTVYLRVFPCPGSAGAKGSGEAIIPLTFD